MEDKINCKICNNELIGNISTKKFCSYDCRNKYHQLIHYKELFRLSDDDKILRLKLLEAKKNE